MGSVGLVNNVSAFNGQHQLNINNLNGALNRLASGIRTNSDADGATDIRTADSLVLEMTNIVTRAVMLASITMIQSEQLHDAISAESPIRDANAAEEMANMTKHRILEQADIAALAHYNVNSQAALSLLQ